MTYAKIDALHPELGAGGYTAYDGTIAFYTRVETLVTPQSTVLDFGAGRAAWAQDDPCTARKDRRWLKGRVKRVIGCDVDDAVKSNPSVDEAVVIPPNTTLPFADGSIDVVIADYVVEHLADPKWFAAEIQRVLAPGGWLVGRTPSRLHYVTLGAALIPSRLHKRFLRRAQGARKSEDVFETHYRLNTLGALKRYFSPSAFSHHSYIYSFEPQYHFGRPLVYRSFRALHRVLPASMTGNIFMFVRKLPVPNASPTRGA